MQTTASALIDQLRMAQRPFRRSAIQSFVKAHNARPLTVVSDGLGCFVDARAAGVHERVVTGGIRKAERRPEFAAINFVLRNLRTSIAGSLHAFDFARYAERYLADFQFRKNHRYGMDLMRDACMHALLRATPITRVQIRAPEIGCRSSGGLPPLEVGHVLLILPLSGDAIIGSLISDTKLNTPGFCEQHIDDDMQRLGLIPL